MTRMLRIILGERIVFVASFRSCFCCRCSLRSSVMEWQELLKLEYIVRSLRLKPNAQIVSAALVRDLGHVGLTLSKLWGNWVWFIREPSSPDSGAVHYYSPLGAAQMSCTFRLSYTVLTTSNNLYTKLIAWHTYRSVISTVSLCRHQTLVRKLAVNTGRSARTLMLIRWTNTSTSMLRLLLPLSRWSNSRWVQFRRM